MDVMSDRDVMSSAGEEEEAGDGATPRPNGTGQDVNPLERQDAIWRRFREQYNSQNRGSLGPLRVEDVEDHLPEQPTTRIGRIRQALTRSGRRERQRVRTVQTIYRMHPGLTAVMIVRIQRTWRGYITRKTLEMIKAAGMGIGDLEAKRVLQSAAHYGRTYKPDLQGIRHLPMSVYGAGLTPTDTSVYRVRITQFIWHFGVVNGGCSGGGLCLLLLWFLGTTGATFLIPGWAAMCLKTFFDDGETSLTIDQLTSWITMFSLVCLIGVGVLHMSLVFEQERFGQKLDFILALVGAKKAKLLTNEQLHELRNEDLGRAKKSIYKSAPLATLHGIHTIAGLIAVLAFDGTLGLITLLTLFIAFFMMALYDRMVHTQITIINEVAKREGILSYYHRKHAIQDEEFTARNYQLGLSKSIMRMQSSFGRVHGIIGCTAVMLVISLTVFFFYAGGKRVQRDHITTHTFVLCLCYFLFTHFSFFKWNEHTVDFLISKTNMRRVFKVVWNFREFSDEAAFKERQCAIVTQAEGLKEYRAQPSSVDLFITVFFITFIVVIWLVYFGVDRGSLQCKSKPIDCLYAGDNGDDTVAGHLTATYGFSFFFACTPMLPRTYMLRVCGYHIITNPDTMQLAGNNPFLARLSYQGWRDYPRGFSKVMTTSFSAVTVNGEVRSMTHVCPKIDLNAKDPLATYPFISESQKVENWQRSGVGNGEALGVSYGSYKEVFFADNEFRGCFSPQPIPDDACNLANPGIVCWCKHGKPKNVTGIC
eukprot:TRINITY_DN3340_c0_g1_i1.p1 TRINITY_DN3340_c0_g1~~TRINITY_DN3340_c0_g1_i1.p1  ORF type:complete len:796 (+),score=106.82 TRINITY_DN3340_c0_g1_i1:107-2389(+)